VVLDRGQHGAGLEARDQAQRAAEAHRDVEDAGQSEHVEQREHGDDDVVLADVEEAPWDVGVHVELEVHQLRAFGSPGRSRGVDDDGGVGRLASDERTPGCRWRGQQTRERQRLGAGSIPDDEDVRHPRLGRPLRRVVEHTGPGDERSGVRVAKVEGDLWGFEQDIHRDRHGAGLQDSEVGDEELREIRQLQADSVPAPQPELLETRGQVVGYRVEVGVRHVPAVVDSDWLVRRCGRRLPQDDGEVEAHRSPSTIARRSGRPAPAVVQRREGFGRGVQ
jgi:hypothetical protein